VAHADSKCEFCSKSLYYTPPEGVIYGVDVCLECEPSRAWFKREIERRYPDGVSPSKGFHEHHFVMRFEPEEEYGWRPVLECIDPCPEDWLLYRLHFDERIFGALCACDAYMDCFDDPAMWFYDMKIKVNLHYHSYQCYDGDWDTDMWVTPIGEEDVPA
jgi:hypothetical protein